MRLLLFALLFTSAACGDDGPKSKAPPPDAGPDLAVDSGGGVGTDARGDTNVVAQDTGADIAAPDMPDEPAMPDGWYATQTVAQRAYAGQNPSGGWHSTTLAVGFFPQPASADEICAATLTGYAFVIEGVDTPWPVTGMHVTVEDAGSTLLERDFAETSPGVWVVEFEDTPIPIEDTAIGERVLNVDIDRATDYAGTSIVTLMAKLEGIEGCMGATPRLRAATQPGWDGAIRAGSYLGWPNLLTPSDVPPGTNDAGFVPLSAGTLGWYSTGTSENPRCGDVTEVWATLDRRGSAWRSSTMTATVRDNDGNVFDTFDLVEVMPDQWRGIPTAPVTVSSDTNLQFAISADEAGERDRFMFRHYWLEAGALTPCP